MHVREPKILIISEFFEAGDAITTLSLFSKWDKTNIFCASRELNNHSNKFGSTYTLGHNEIKYVFPISKFKKVAPGGESLPVTSLKENRKGLTTNNE